MMMIQAVACITNSPHTEGLAPPLSDSQHTEVSSDVGVNYLALPLALSAIALLSVEGFWCRCKWRRTTLSVGRWATKNLNRQYKMDLLFSLGKGVMEGLDIRRLGGEHNWGA